MYSTHHAYNVYKNFLWPCFVDFAANFQFQRYKAYQVKFLESSVKVLMNKSHQSIIFIMMDQKEKVFLKEGESSRYVMQFTCFDNLVRS